MRVIMNKSTAEMHKSDLRKSKTYIWILSGLSSQCRHHLKHHNHPRRRSPHYNVLLHLHFLFQSCPASQVSELTFLAAAGKNKTRWDAHPDLVSVWLKSAVSCSSMYLVHIVLIKLNIHTGVICHFHIYHIHIQYSVWISGNGHF